MRISLLDVHVCRYLGSSIPETRGICVEFTRGIVMKMTLWIVALAVITSCGQQPTGEHKFARAIAEGVQTADELLLAFRKHNFKNMDDALEWIKTQPILKTIGIKSNLFADELGVTRVSWGRLINEDSDLVLKRRSKNYGSISSYIFLDGYTPTEQITKALNKFFDEDHRQSVAIEEVVKEVSFVSDMSHDGINAIIGKYIDKTKFILKEPPSKRKKYIYRKENLSPEGQMDKIGQGAVKEVTKEEKVNQVAKALDKFFNEDLRKKVAIEEIADEVSFGSEMKPHGLHIAISKYINKDEFITKQLTENHKTTTYVLRNPSSIDNQIGELAKSLDIPPRILREYIKILTEKMKLTKKKDALAQKMEELDGKIDELAE